MDPQPLETFHRADWFPRKALHLTESRNLVLDLVYTKYCSHEFVTVSSCKVSIHREHAISRSSAIRHASLLTTASSGRYRHNNVILGPKPRSYQ